MRRKLAAGNWKMNGLRAALAEVEKLAADHPSPAAEIVLSISTAESAEVTRYVSNSTTISADIILASTGVSR